MIQLQPQESHRKAAIEVVLAPGNWSEGYTSELRDAIQKSLAKMYDQGFLDEAGSMELYDRLPGAVAYLKNSQLGRADVKVIQAHDWIYTIGSRDCAVIKAHESEKENVSAEPTDPRSQAV